MQHAVYLLKCITINPFFSKTYFVETYFVAKIYWE